jgi:enoyl-CoA hydratase/carnithine racemase
MKRLMATTQLSLVKVDVADGIATLTINRPDVLNNINFVVIHQLHQALLQAIADPAVQGIVLAGAGKVFVVGADIDFLIRNIEGDDIPRIIKYSEAGHALMNAIDDSPKPVVARVGGMALGGGLELALACDRIVAAQGTTFGFPETGLGIYPGFGGTQRSSRRVGVGLAKWLIFTAKSLAASEALKIGLIDQVVAADQLDDAVGRAAREPITAKQPVALSPEYAALAQFFASHRAADLRAGIVDTHGDAALARAMKLVANKGPIALAFAESIIERGSQRPLAEGLRMEIEHVTELFQTADALLGLQFRAKRQLGQPVFAGR